MQESKVNDQLQSLTLFHKNQYDFERKFLKQEPTDYILNQCFQALKSHLTHWENYEKALHKKLSDRSMDQSASIKQHILWLQERQGHRFNIQMIVLDRCKLLYPQVIRNPHERWAKLRDELKEKLNHFLLDLMALRNVNREDDKALKTIGELVAHGLQKLKHGVRHEAVSNLMRVYQKILQKNQNIVPALPQNEFILDVLANQNPIAKTLFGIPKNSPIVSEQTSQIEYSQSQEIKQQILEIKKCLDEIFPYIQNISPNQINDLPYDVRIILDLMARLDDAPIKTIQACQLLKEKAHQQHHALIQAFQQKKNALNNLIQAYDATANLLDDTCPKDVLLHGYNTKQTLNNALFSINKLQDYYTQRFYALTKDKTASNFNALLQEQHTYHLQLNSEILSVKSNINALDDQTQTLTLHYVNEKQKMIGLLEKKIEQARKIEQLDVTLAIDQSIIDNVFNRLELLKEQRHALPDIAVSVNSDIQMLDKHISSLTETIKNKYITSINQLIQRYAHVLKTISEHAASFLDLMNPYKNSLETARKNCIQKQNDIREHLQKLDHISTENLEQWHQALQHFPHETDTHINTLLDIKADAQEIERRLKHSPIPSALNGILETLRTEYKRIEENYNNGKYGKESEPRKDPRIKTIRQIMQSFLAFRAEYIPAAHHVDRGKRLEKFKNGEYPSDKHYCQQLINLIQEHLQRNDMERLSAHRRSQFAQFVREHIFKPLQMAMSRLKAAINKSDPRFVVTIGATVTEKTIVKLGQTQLERLKHQKNKMLERNMTTRLDGEEVPRESLMAFINK